MYEKLRCNKCITLQSAMTEFEHLSVSSSKTEENQVEEERELPRLETLRGGVNLNTYTAMYVMVTIAETDRDNSSLYVGDIS